MKTGVSETEGLSVDEMYMEKKRSENESGSEDGEVYPSRYCLG